MNRIASIFIVLLAFAAMTLGLYALDPVFNKRVNDWRGTSPAELQGPIVDSNVQNENDAVIKKKEKGGKGNIAPNPWKLIDAHAIKASASSPKNIVSLADFLVKPCKTEMDKARVIFRWMTKNISYDDVGFNENDMRHYSAEETLERKKGVCEDFSNLFVAIAEPMGLEAVKISGYAKGYGYKEGSVFQKSNHAWNAFKANGKWHLIDVTWGEGYGTNVNGKLKSSKRFKPFWFDVDPNAFIFRHLPEDPKWQLVERPINKSTYEKMASADDGVFDFGFDNASLFQACRTGEIKKLPVIYSNEMAVKAIRASMHGTLFDGETYDFVFDCPKCKSMYFMNNDARTILKKDGSQFSTQIVPTEGKLELYSNDGKSNLFLGVVKYDVARGRSPMVRR